MTRVPCVKLLPRVTARLAAAHFAVVASLVHVPACVPEERPGPPKAAPSASIGWAPMRSYRSVPRVVTPARATASASAAAASAAAGSAPAASELLQQPFADSFERDDLGVNYLATTSAWK